MNLINIFKSRIIAILLMIFLVIFSLIILLVSYISRDSVVKVYQSDIVFIFTALFLISLLVCSIYRLRSDLGDVAKIGSVLFHLSLMFVTIGAVYNHVFHISARLVIAEGQSIECSDENLLALKSGRFSYKSFKNFIITLNKLYVKYKSGVLVDLTAKITFVDKKKRINKNSTISVNYPFYHDNYKFLLHDYGVAPVFVLKENGRIINQVTANLNLLSRKKGKQDDFSFNNWNIGVNFYPDHYIEGTNDMTGSMELKNPLFKINIREENTDRELFSGKVKIKEPVQIDKYTLSIEDVRYWTHFYLSLEDGIKLVYIGFWLSIIGLLMRYLKIKKRLSVNELCE